MSKIEVAAPPQALAAARPPRKEGELRRSVRLMSQFLAGQRKQFSLALVMLIAEAATAASVPLVMAVLIDYITKRVAAQAVLSPLQALGLPMLVNPDVDTVIVVSVGIVLLTLLNSFTDSMAEIYLANGGRLLGYNMRVKLYEHLQKLSLAFYSKQRTGDLLSRVTSDVSAVEEFVIKSLSDIVGSFLLIGFILFIMITGAWEVAVVAALIIPFMALISNYFSQRIKAAAKKQRAREGDLASAAQEMITSIRVIQAYGSSGGESRRFAEQSRKAMDTSLESARLQALFSGTVSTLESVAVALVIWLSVYLLFGPGIFSNGFTTLSAGFGVGLLTAYTKYIADMFKPTKKIIKEWNTFGKIYASIDRIGELMDRKPAVVDRPDAQIAPRFAGSVAFNNVSFAYMPDPEDLKEGETLQPKLALREISFAIAPGEVVALVGPSGAGKSTVVQLLPRLYDPHAGTITIDGVDTRAFTVDSLRSQMSVVLQEAILFTGTVAANIAYGRPDATREEIVAAAMQANAHDFIERLPNGYDTELSERAANLSGGQRQRISIARAFIRNTPILILDEPTTGLDAESTDLVRLALRELMRGKATVIISHDLNLIRQADRIVVIRAGQVAETGGHKELLKQGGLYADLYHKQFGRAVEEEAEKLAPIEPALAAEADDDEEEPAVSAKVFHTMIGMALPAPASPQAFQTIMLQALPAELAPPALGAAAASPQPQAQAASAAPAAAPKAPAAPRQPAKFGTVLLPALTLEPQAASAKPAPAAPPAGAPAVDAGPSNEHLDLLASPVLQDELPGLATALDGGAMREYLQSALFGKTRPQYSIESCAPGKALYQGESCVLRYQLTIRHTGNGEELRPVVVGRVFGDMLAGATYMRDKLAPLAALMRGREEIAPFATPLAMIEPLAMVVYAFPIDGELPTLVGATDRERMRALFAELLPEAGIEPGTIKGLRIVPVNYARRERCVLRYELDEAMPDGSQQRRVIYGKVSSDNQGATIAPLVTELRERALGHGVEFALPQALAFRPDLQLSLLTAVPGAPRVAELLKARLSGGAEQGLQLEEALATCAQIAAALHSTPSKAGARRTLDHDLAVIREEIREVQRIAPELGAQFQGWLERIELYAEESDPLRPSLSHGDYTHAQVIFDGKRSGLVDFDTICQAEPALDLGQFLAYMRVAAHKAGKAAASSQARLGEELGDHFLNEYAAALGPRLEDAERMRVRVQVYQVVSLLRMALHSWQQIKPARVANALAVLQDALAALPQLDYESGGADGD
jgi:ABC-type multidrug transport system fused ATPase/permease subunit/thiamine kinase-like enzyme